MRYSVLILIFSSLLLTTTVVSGEIAKDDITPLELEEEMVNQSKNDPPEIGSSVFKMMLSLGVVVLLIGASGWLAKKYLPVQKIGGQNTDFIQIVSQKNVGNKQSVMLIKVKNTTLLVGRSPGSMNTLCELEDEPEGHDPVYNIENNNFIKPEFQQELEKLIVR